MPNLDILRTRVVSIQELLGEVDLWRPPIENELKQLFKDRGAPVELTREEVRELRERHSQALEISPMKPVLTKKPGPMQMEVQAGGTRELHSEAREEMVYSVGSEVHLEERS